MGKKSVLLPCEIASKLLVRIVIILLFFSITSFCASSSSQKKETVESHASFFGSLGDSAEEKTKVCRDMKESLLKVLGSDHRHLFQKVKVEAAKDMCDLEFLADIVPVNKKGVKHSYYAVRFNFLLLDAPNHIEKLAREIELTYPTIPSLNQLMGAKRGRLAKIVKRKGRACYILSFVYDGPVSDIPHRDNMILTLEDFGDDYLRNLQVPATGIKI